MEIILYNQKSFQNQFRIAAVGSITEVNHVTTIVKKLKLVGYPREIFRKTAFIKVNIQV